MKDFKTLLLTEEQTESLCIEAVQTDGMLLEFVENQTNKIQDAALKNNPAAEKFENITMDVVREAVIEGNVARLAYCIKKVQSTPADILEGYATNAWGLPLDTDLLDDVTSYMSNHDALNYYKKGKVK